MRDIIELRWHLEDKTRRLKHFEEQKRKLEEANAKLQADIDYMNKHRPLLLAKRDQDLEALREYYQKKFEVSENNGSAFYKLLLSYKIFNYNKLAYF